MTFTDKRYYHRGVKRKKGGKGDPVQLLLFAVGCRLWREEMLRDDILNLIRELR